MLPILISALMLQVAGPAVAQDAGEMRLEPLIMYEQRFLFLEEMPGRAPVSNLQMRLRLAGERIGEVKRVGKVIVEEAIDDQGKALFDPNSYSEADRTSTQLINASPEDLRQRGFPVPIRLDVASRGAEKITKLEGTLKLVYATETEDIIIVNPLQFLGKPVKHPRLAELGIEMFMVKPGDAPGTDVPNRGVAFTFDAGEDKLVMVDFCDPWLRPMLPRKHSQPANNGKMATIYELSGVGFEDDSQMTIRVFPELETQTLKFELKDVALP